MTSLLIKPLLIIVLVFSIIFPFGDMLMLSKGCAIFPAIAEAATIAGEAKYASAVGSPILPLKFRFVADMPTSLGPKRPTTSPLLSQAQQKAPSSTSGNPAPQSSQQQQHPLPYRVL